MERRLAAKTTRIGSLKTISADIPTGSLKTPNTRYSNSHRVCSLAAHAVYKCSLKTSLRQPENEP